MSVRHPIILPRALIFVASIWLIGSWMITIGFVPPVHPSSASYEPGVQQMLISLAIGLMVGWPLLRLSQAAHGASRRQTVLDLVVLTSMIQVVLWPLRLVTRWSLERTAAIDATLVGWMLVAGAIVAAATATANRGVRALAMIACLGLCLVGPALGALGVGGDLSAPALLELSPLVAIRSLGDGGGAPLTALQWRWLGVLGAAGGLAWIALALAPTPSPPRPASPITE